MNNFDEQLKTTQDLQQKFCAKIDSMIPVDWSHLAFYGEILDTSRIACFYFQEENKNDWIYSVDIPKVYNVDQSIYDRLVKELYEILADYRQAYKQIHNDIWSIMKFQWTRNGKFELSFKYIDILSLETDFPDRVMAWEYITLKKIPSSDFERKCVIQALSEEKDQTWLQRFKKDIAQI